MNAEARKRLLAAQPFEPVEVVLSSGQVWPIRHPENVMVLKNTLVIAEPETDMVQWTSLLHIAAIRPGQETLPTA